MTKKDASDWMSQWRAAAQALDEVREEELALLDESRNAAIAASFFIVPGEERPPAKTSGLVEQQAIFLRAR